MQKDNWSARVDSPESTGAIDGHASLVLRIVQIIGVACLAVTLLATGFFVCTLEVTTRTLSQHCSSFESSPYAHDELVTLAVETRGLTVEDYGRADGGAQAARERLSTQIEAAAQASCKDTQKHMLWSESARAVLDRAQEGSSAASETVRKLAAISDSYALDDDVFSHLEDCNRLIASVMPILLAIAFGAVVCLALLLAAQARRHAPVARRMVWQMLVVAPCVMVCALVVLLVWALVDFNGLFAAFHTAFFPQGNWTFGNDSLLISLYPLRFWTGMAGVWAAVTALLSALSLVLGLCLRKRLHKKDAIR